MLKLYILRQLNLRNC